MDAVLNLRKAICSLFEVHLEGDGTRRIVTPLEYPGSGDHIVVRVRPTSDGFQIDESGEASLAASMAGGDLEAEPLLRWAEDLAAVSPVRFADDVVQALAASESYVPSYVFRVAEAAQQLHAIATSRADRRSSDFKARVAEVVRQVAAELDVPYRADVELPIAGGLRADHVIDLEAPLILFAANSPARLLEAEVVYMQYRSERRKGAIMAIAESQAAVGRKQFERAGYYTHRTLVWNADALAHLVRHEAQTSH